jgi:hypothetical protein
VDFADAFSVFLRAAGNEVKDFMAGTSPRYARSRYNRRRASVTESELEEAARWIYRVYAAEEGLSPEPDAEQLREVVDEGIAQALEEWWQKLGSATLRDPEKRRQVWWFIQERLGGQELQPAP